MQLFARRPLSRFACRGSTLKQRKATIKKIVCGATERAETVQNSFPLLHKATTFQTTELPLSCGVCNDDVTKKSFSEVSLPSSCVWIRGQSPCTVTSYVPQTSEAAGNADGDQFYFLITVRLFQAAWMLNTSKYPLSSRPSDPEVDQERPAC